MLILFEIDVALLLLCSLIWTRITLVIQITIYDLVQMLLNLLSSRAIFQSSVLTNNRRERITEAERNLFNFLFFYVLFTNYLTCL